MAGGREVSGNPIDWDSDVPKHFVRTKGWLPGCGHQYRLVKSQRRRGRRVPFKYFTFCGSKAVDVFMLERAGILKRSEKTGRLQGVYFCEQLPDDFHDTQVLLGADAVGFLGNFEQICLFENGSDTEGRRLTDSEAEYYEAPVREKLKVKEAHLGFIDSSPYDVINLDVSGVMFPPRDAVASPMLRAMRQMFDWQNRPDAQDGHACEAFTLLLTTHIDASELNQAAVSQLLQRMNDNVERYVDYSTELQATYRVGTAEELAERDFSIFYALALPKIVIEDALKTGWDVEYRGILLYTRLYEETGEPYRMMASVALVKRRPPELEEELHPEGGPWPERIRDRYVQEIVEIVHYGAYHLDADIGDPQQFAEVERDLKKVVEFRDTVRTKLGEQP